MKINNLKTLLLILLVMGVSSCTSPYTKLNTQHSPCEKKNKLYEENGVNTVTPCLTGVLNDQRFYFGLGERRFVYRYETNPSLMGKMKVFGHKDQPLAKKDDMAEQTSWVFKESKNAEVFTKLIVEKKTCIYKDIEFELTLQFTHLNNIYNGCGYFIQH